ncbi:hypothetical protein E2562_018007, partial [Oryza meyeriana var. granulata]
ILPCRLTCTAMYIEEDIQTGPVLLQLNLLLQQIRGAYMISEILLKALQGEIPALELYNTSANCQGPQYSGMEDQCPCFSLCPSLNAINLQLGLLIKYYPAPQMILYRAQ